MDKFQEIINNKDDITNKIKLNELKDFLTSRDSVSLDIASRTQEVSKIQNQLLSIKEEIDIIRRQELDRINKEFLTNNYSRRYNNVNLKTVIHALVGKEFSDNEINKQLKDHKVKLYNNLDIL